MVMCQTETVGNISLSTTSLREFWAAYA
jgi:hypothetical protein